MEFKMELIMLVVNKKKDKPTNKYYYSVLKILKMT